MRGIKFGSFNMQTGGCTVTGTDVFSAPTNDIQADELAEDDGSVIVKQRYKSKAFIVEGWLRATTQMAFDALRDSFKLAMAQRNQAFDIDYGSSTRRYLGNASNSALIDTSPTSCTFSVQFLSPDGMGWDLNSTALLTAAGVTQANQTLGFTVGGTYMCEPLITVTLSALTGGTTKAITISNGDTVRGLTITRTWVAGDQITIDCLNKTVYVNNAPVAFTGVFPTWSVGAATLSWSDGLTTRTAAVNVSHTQRWL
jgi:hypothetical protein